MDHETQSERWERRMVDMCEVAGPRAWLDEARLERCRRLAAEAKRDHYHAALTAIRADARSLRRQLEVSEQSEHDRGLMIETVTRRNTIVRNHVWGLVGCRGLRTELCRDCDWGDGVVCLADGKSLGEWGES